MSTAIRFDPDAAAATLLAEQSERERVIRELAASYGDILDRESALDASRDKHLRLRQEASEFGITDAALKKAGIPSVSGRAKKTTPRKNSRKSGTGSGSGLGDTAASAGFDSPSNGDGTHA